MGCQTLSGKNSVALVLGADITDGRKIRGGVVVVASFIHQQLLESGRYIPHFVSLATSFRDKNSVRLLAPSTWKSGPQLTEGEWANIPYTHAGAFLTEFEFQRYLPRKRLTAFLNRFDLIQVVSGSPAAAYVAKDVRKPICVQAATTTWLERKSLIAQATVLRKLYGILMLSIVSHIEKKVIKQADHIFADTAYTRQAFLPYTPDSKITIDVIGVDTTQFQPIAEEQRTNDYILSVGRFADMRKNVKMLFKAYAILREQMHSTPKLVLAGISGPSESDWELARELRILDHIECHLEVPRDQLVSLYQNAAVLALSSVEEGLGIVLLEAMACATPVVSTRCGGPDTVVSDRTGFLTPVGDAEAMADRLLWMLQNPEMRRQMGQAGRQMVETRFSTGVVGQKYLDVYDRLLGIKSP